MTGGESRVSNADIDALLLDFMRVVFAQYELQRSEEIGDKGTRIWLYLDHSAPLFTALGLRPQSVEVQWMLIFKLYRELCTDVMAAYKDGSPLKPAKIPFGFHIDYRELNPEVMLDVVPLTFRSLYERLSANSAADTPKAEEYICRLWQQDNQLMLAINGDSFQVAKMQDGRWIGKIITALLNAPAGRVIHAIDIAPMDDSFDFEQHLSKNNFKWLRSMLSTRGKKSIALRNPSTWSANDMLAMISEINEKYRKPIQQHFNLG